MRWMAWLLGVLGVVQYAVMAYVDPSGYVSLDMSYLVMWLAVIGGLILCNTGCGCWSGGGCSCCGEGCSCGDCGNCMGGEHSHGEHSHEGHGHEGHKH